MIQADQVWGLSLDDEGRDNGIQCRQPLRRHIESLPRFDKHRLVAAMSDIASVEKFVEPTTALVLAPITDKGRPVQFGAGIVLGLEVLAGGITEPAVPA